jgi:hypothetical protein
VLGLVLRGVLRVAEGSARVSEERWLLVGLVAQLVCSRSVVEGSPRFSEVGALSVEGSPRFSEVGALVFDGSSIQRGWNVGCNV